MVVTPKDGVIFSGILLDACAKSFHFADINVIDSNGSRSAPGELWIDRANVAYMQRVATAAKE
jgi:hypothetical protein